MLTVEDQRTAAAPAGTAPPDPGRATLQTLDPLESPDWDDRVRSCPDVTFAHSAAWAAVLHDTYRLRPLYIAATDGQQLAALLPVIETGTWLTGARGVSLPFTDYCPFLVSIPGRRIPGTEEALLARLWAWVLDFGRGRGWRTIECRCGRPPAPSAPASLTFHRHTLDLRAGPETLFARVDGAVRRAIRKARQQSVAVESSATPEAVAAYYRLHCETRRRHGLPPQPFRFFEAIRRHCLESNAGRLFIAHHHARPVAGAIFLHFGTRVAYKFGASDPAAAELRANNLVMWEAIEGYSRQGFTTLDFGRTSMSQEGLRRYKLGWGTTETALDYFKYDLRRDRFVTDRDRAHGWYNRLFRCLPVPVLKGIGRAIYPHLA